MMELDDQTKILLELSTKLGSIDAKLSNVCESLLRHESRLSLLEQKFEKHVIDVAANTQPKTVFDRDTIRWLVKALLIATGIIATLTGAGTILDKICK